ncbi:MAG: NAD(P)(+) transhydrogenase (Re/Si-specific) subunit beta [Phycisphaerae bacterium]
MMLPAETNILAFVLAPQWQDLFYLLAAVMFIIALKALGSPRTARKGNLIGAIGMLLAVVVTMLAGELSFVWIIAGLVIGGVIGAYLALTVQMTSMPQMVAMFNGFGGLASALVVLGEVFGAKTVGPRLAVTVGISTLIGWVTFTGSLIAFGKLQEFVVSSRPITFPLQKVVNLVVLLAAVAIIVVVGFFPEMHWMIIPLAVIAAILGVLFVIPIGGADMPVVISLLNSYSGLAAAATGFVIGNVGLIISGTLVGASGVILTRLMCVAMNRSLANVLFGAVGGAGTGPAGDKASVKRYTPADAAMVMENANMVIIVPGYGMAVAQAQHAVKEMTNLLESRGVEVKFGVHPVAGRMPGHMNVLLAEAEVDYDKLLDMEEINPEFEQCDAVFVLGANDVVNPVARQKTGTPLDGMPILNVDHARTVIISKRSLSPGFAGVDNPMFYDEKTMMVFGDGKKTVNSIVAELKQ